MNDVRVEVSYRLSTESETRYVVVDVMTGRVVDSANGHVLLVHNFKIMSIKVNSVYIFSPECALIFWI